MKLISHPMSVVSIDPGMSGAVAAMGYNTLTVRRDFKELPEIAEAVRDLIIDSGPSAVAVVIELVNAMPGQGVCSMFSFGKSTGVAFGAIWTALERNGIPVVEVAPQKWQNWFRKELDIPRPQKFDSCEIARRLLPDHAELFKRKKDHNTADAVLIGIWYLNNHANN